MESSSSQLIHDSKFVDVLRFFCYCSDKTKHRNSSNLKQSFDFLVQVDQSKMVDMLCVDPKFRLHFKDRNVAFANGFAELFKNENQCDLTFVVQGKELKAHRHILSFVSKALNELFVGRSIFDPIEGKRLFYSFYCHFHWNFLAFE